MPLAFLASACGSGQVSVAHYALTPAGQRYCPAFMAALPQHVSDQPRRRTTGERYAAAWGDPPIVLRCGVGRPAGYTTSSPCQTRNGIGWFVPPAQIDDLGSDVTMTLVHRAPFVEVEVPASYRPNGPANVMAALDAAIRKATVARGRCV